MHLNIIMRLRFQTQCTKQDRERERKMAFEVLEEKNVITLIIIIQLALSKYFFVSYAEN
jgi:hypothetical protein